LPLSTVVSATLLQREAVEDIVIKIKKRSTRREYVARINRVLDFMQNNLHKKLDLYELAEVAAFSPFHFHRIFRGVVGESINDYVNRIRLERAANLLKYNPDTPITDICFETCFSSSSSFARAFKRHFGVSASQFRDENSSRVQEMNGANITKISKFGETIRKSSIPNSNQGKDTPPKKRYGVAENVIKRNQERRNEHMKVQVKNLPAYRVAYVRVLDGYNSEKIGLAFHKVTTWARARDLMGPETLVLGISLDNPEITPADKCRYDACVSVPQDTQGEGEVGVYDIPAGKYAIYRTEGEYARISEQIGRGWDDLMGNWFPDSGYQPDDRPCFEISRETEEEMKAGKFIVDICEPVKPL
jgi:AraC family transcriptional regulator